MEDNAQILLTLGAILLVGLATDVLGRRTALPRVTLMLVFGMLIGPGMLDLIPALVIDRFELIASMALLMVGFLALNTFLTHNIGRMMGGQGSFDATLTLMAWFQVVSLALTAVQFVLMLLSPILGLLFSVVSFALLLRCMVMFVDVLHGFGHLGKAFGTALAALFASVLVGVLFLPLLGVEMPGGPI